MAKHRQKVKLRKKASVFITVLLFTLIGAGVVLLLHAASQTATLEPETGSVSSEVAIANDASASRGQYVQFAASGSNCAKTAHTKTFSSFVNYLDQAGDQVIVVPNGTYAARGIASTSRSDTPGPCKGWLVIKAETQNGVTLDLSGSDTGLTLNGNRVMLIGFKFVKGSVFANANDIGFWYDDMSFFQTTHATSSLTSRQAEMTSYGYTKARVLYPVGDRVHIYGSNLHNACSIIRVRNNLSDLLIQGSHLYDSGPTMDDGGPNQCHANAIGMETVTQRNFQVLDSEIEGPNARGFEMESADTSSSFTLKNAWVHNAIIGVHTSSSYKGTCDLNNIYAWSNSTTNFFFESGNNCQKNSTVHEAAPPTGAASPQANWQASHPYDSWETFL